MIQRHTLDWLNERGRILRGAFQPPRACIFIVIVFLSLSGPVWLGLLSYQCHCVCQWKAGTLYLYVLINTWTGRRNLMVLLDRQNTRIDPRSINFPGLTYVWPQSLSSFDCDVIVVAYPVQTRTPLVIAKDQSSHLVHLNLCTKSPNCENLNSIGGPICVRTTEEKKPWPASCVLLYICLNSWPAEV